MATDNKKNKSKEQNEGQELATLETATTAAQVFENKAESELDKFKTFKSEVLTEMSKTSIESAADLNKHLADVTADTQAQAAAINQLSTLPFDKLIGEPLNAAIAAQSEAAKSTLKFIQSVGLKNDKIIMVSFEYIQNGQIVKFQIPLLTLVPIPTFAIKALDYEFKIKIDSSSSASSSTSNSLLSTWNASYNMAATPAQTINQDNETPAPTTEEEKGTNTDQKAKQQIEEDKKKKAETEAKKKAAEAEQKAKLAEAAATALNTAQGPSMSASISTKKDSTATRESKYSVEATMDVRINAGQDDLPAGVLTILEILNNAHNTFDPDGELTVSSSEVTIGSNDKASVMVKYINEEGVYAPASIKCTDGSVDVINKSSAKVTFTKAGVYAITAGTQSESVKVNPKPTTNVLITEETPT